LQGGASRSIAAFPLGKEASYHHHHHNYPYFD